MHTSKVVNYLSHRTDEIKTEIGRSKVSMAGIKGDAQAFASNSFNKIHHGIHVFNFDILNAQSDSQFPSIIGCLPVGFQELDFCSDVPCLSL